MMDARQKPVVYLETSFVSYLTGRVSGNPQIALNQAATRRWWETMRDKVRPVVSYLVRAEISAGNAEAVSCREDAIRDLPSWNRSKEAMVLADCLIRAHALPETEQADAVHVAVAAVGGADILLTWNCRHIANPVTLPKTVEIVLKAGLKCPAIATPAQLLEVQNA